MSPALSRVGISMPVVARCTVFGSWPRPRLTRRAGVEGVPRAAVVEFAVSSMYRRGPSGMTGTALATGAECWRFPQNRNKATGSKATGRRRRRAYLPTVTPGVVRKAERRERRQPASGQLLNRREFNALGLAVGSNVAVSATIGALSASLVRAEPTGAISDPLGRTVKCKDGPVVVAIGQGSARLGQGRHPEAAEEEALRTGLSLGMTLIDTAEIYGDGNAERLIGRVIADRRNQVFLVSKVWPTHAVGNGIERACEGSLARLGTDHLDLYLLHWPNEISDFSGVVTAFEKLRSAGKIRGAGSRWPGSCRASGCCYSGTVCGSSQPARLPNGAA
jgi:Aldo/keto reductase family